MHRFPCHPQLNAHSIHIAIHRPRRLRPLHPLHPSQLFTSSPTFPSPPLGRSPLSLPLYDRVRRKTYSASSPVFTQNNQDRLLRFRRRCPTSSTRGIAAAVSQEQTSSHLTVAGHLTDLCSHPSRQCWYLRHPRRADGTSASSPHLIPLARRASLAGSLRDSMPSNENHAHTLSRPLPSLPVCCAWSLQPVSVIIEAQLLRGARAQHCALGLVAWRPRAGRVARVVCGTSC